VKKKQSDLAALVRSLQAQVEGLNAEVTFWRTRYFELVAVGPIRRLVPRRMTFSQEFGDRSRRQIRNTGRRAARLWKDLSVSSLGVSSLANSRLSSLGNQARICERI
jgi:hypothetical protein